MPIDANVHDTALACLLTILPVSACRYVLAGQADHRYGASGEVSHGLNLILCHVLLLALSASVCPQRVICVIATCSRQRFKV